MSFAKRLIQKRNELNLLQQDIADAIHINRSSISYWEKENLNHFPSRKNLKKLAKFLKVDSDWLIFGDDHPNFQPKDDIFKNESCVQVRFVFNESSILSPNQVEEWLKSKHSENEMSTSQEKFFSFKIEGDSMINMNNLPESIFPGEIALVNCSALDSLKSGDVVLAQFGFTDNFKARIYYLDGKDAYLKALNPSFQPVPLDDNIKMIGKITQTVKIIRDK